MTYTLPPMNPLRAFEAAARHLSFKLAAHELHVTPGAVGQQVKALEERLGVRLFERLHKQLALTPAGLPELAEGKVGVLIDRRPGHHSGYRCERLEAGLAAGDYLICPEGTAGCPEIESLRAWLTEADAAGRVVRFPGAAVRRSG